ncbi:MAG: hypothetical protein ABW003_05020 [Microvirga sp.]
MSDPSTRELDVILMGIGSLGSLVIDCLKTGYPLIHVVGAIDNAPDMMGKKLAELYPDYREAGDVVVTPDLATCLVGLSARPDILIHMTESVLEHIEGQMTQALDAGINVLSASEAMFHPALRHSGVAARLDAAARHNRVSISGTGINPGFSFDSLPLMLARATSGVTKINITRTIDVTGTGPGDIDHVGDALRPDEFRAKIASGRIHGHIGMPESIAAIAERLNMTIDRVEESWETETADFPVDSGTPALGMIEPGRVIGIIQKGAGYDGETLRITMRLVMYYQPERFGLEAADTVEIVGAHHVRASLRPAALSLFGAANVIVNALHDVVNAPPGLVNTLDFSIGGARRGGFRYTADFSGLQRAGLVRLNKVPG